MVVLRDMKINVEGTDLVDNEYYMLSIYGFKSYINVNTRTPLNFRHACLDHIFDKK